MLPANFMQIHAPSHNFNTEKFAIKKNCQKCLFCHFRLAGTNDAFTTASYIISKPLKVKGDNNSILSPNATNILPGNSYATYFNEYKHWFVGHSHRN